MNSWQIFQQIIIKISKGIPEEISVILWDSSYSSNHAKYYGRIPEEKLEDTPSKFFNEIQDWKTGKIPEGVSEKIPFEFQNKSLENLSNQSLQAS